MEDRGGSHHHMANSGPGAPVKENSPGRGGPGGSPPWELSDSPLLLDPAVRPPSDVMTGPPAATPEQPDRPERPRPIARRRAHRASPWSLLDGVPLLLVVILAAQAAMSLRLIWTNTAFLDEATYLYAGHVELAHWLHGTPVPAYATYFSGAPAVYPPLAAIAAHFGGLAGARMLSLAFMLATTCFLWGMTKRLFGQWAAFTAAALFAALGPTQFLGAFATYDAMALSLMAAAAWCVVAAHDRQDSSWLLIAGAVLLALANATKYASMLFDPTIVALSGLTVVMRRGTADTTERGRIKAAVGRAGLVAAATVALDAGLLALGGSWYLAGLMSTTISRTAGTSSPSQILADAADWIGLACIPAALAVLFALARRQRRVEAIIVALLAVSAALAPLNQARIHTSTSLSKHVDFGVWFAAAAAGYLVAQLARVSRRRRLAAGAAFAAAAAALVPTAIVGSAQSATFFRAWPDTSEVTYELASLTRGHPGRYLTEDDDIPAYYLRNQVTWQQWYDTWYFAWRPPGGPRTLIGLPAYKAAILHHYFTLVILDFGDTATTDTAITAYLKEADGYRVIAELPYWDGFGAGQFTVWQYQPQTAATQVHRSSSDRRFRERQR
jgi:Dolichyl-phosphate-mannose-protein mannosyltransferase